MQTPARAAGTLRYTGECAPHAVSHAASELYSEIHPPSLVLHLDAAVQDIFTSNG